MTPFHLLATLWYFNAHTVANDFVIRTLVARQLPTNVHITHIHTHTHTHTHTHKHTLLTTGQSLVCYILHKCQSIPNIFHISYEYWSVGLTSHAHIPVKITVHTSLQALLVHFIIADIAILEGTKISEPWISYNEYTCSDLIDQRQVSISHQILSIMIVHKKIVQNWQFSGYHHSKVPGSFNWFRGTPALQPEKTYVWKYSYLPTWNDVA